MTVKRPMLLLSAALVAGMYLFALLNAEASLMVLFLLFLTTIVACIKKRQLYTNLILICAFLLFLSGYFYYALKSDVSIRQLYNDCGKQCTLTGEVVGNIEETDQYIRFFLKTKSIDIDGENRAVDEKISAICFKDENSTSITPTLNRGDVISLHCKLELPSNAMNTNGFNYRSYYKSQGVYFEAIANATQLSVVGHQTHTIKDAIHCFRTKCTALFDSTFPKEESGILKAYIVGETSDITQEIKDAFSISGLSHVLSISGMHVAVFISSFTAFLWFLKIPKRKQMVLSVCAIVLFVIFTGGSIATIRAGLVCLIALFAQLVFRHSDPMTALAEAAAVLCIWNPFVILDASFLLSFSATFGIILFSAGISQRLSVVYRRIPIEFRIRRLLKTICVITAVGISANLFIIPILVSLFNQFSIVSILATIAITPL
ncbi:MAG: ComEC/Rec2 family competence protein, partial [Clostridia bacterium]|nr:ComEC/Rec2 family competence protein [Clostridia bacterium]